jgi:hypothetical protein
MWSGQFGGNVSLTDSGWALLGAGGLTFVQGTAAPGGERLVMVRPPGNMYDVTIAQAADEYPIYEMPQADGTIRLMALVEPGRQTSQFIDPAQPDTLIEWAGNWRTLYPLHDTRASLEFRMKFRLDTPDSFLRVGFTDGLPASEIISYLVEVRSDKATIFERGNADFPDEAIASRFVPVWDTWHTLSIRAQPGVFSIWIDDQNLSHMHVMPEIYPDIAYPLLETSAAPATISLDDIEIASYSTGTGG